jgi:hypothetical protein
MNPSGESTRMLKTRRSPLPINARTRLAGALAPDAAAVLLLALLVIFFGWRMITPDLADRQFIVAGDFTNQFYPFHRFLSDELRAWRLPLWNPYVYGGHPFQADPQTGVFYPLNLVFAAAFARGGFPFVALEAQVLANLALAAALTYGFARHLTASRIGGLFGAIAFTFSGFLTSYPVQQFAMLQTAVWFPGVMWATSVAMRPQRVPGRSVVVAALSLALCFLAGHSQTFLFIVYTAVAYGAVAGRQNSLGWRPILIRLAAIGGLFAGLVAIQALPTIEFARLSNRIGLDFEASAYAYELKAFGGALLPGWRDEKGLYAGIATLALAGFAWLQTDRRPLVFWSALAIVGAILSVGGHTIFFRFLYLLAPGFGLFRDQERAGVIVVFALAMLGAHGAAAFTRADSPGFGTLVRALAVSFALSIVFTAQVLVLWTGANAQPQNPYHALFESAVFLAVALGLTFVVSLIRATGRGRMLPARARSDPMNHSEALGESADPSLMASSNGWFERRKLAVAMLVAVLAFDLLSVNWRNNLTEANSDVSQRFQAALAPIRAEGELYRVRADHDEVVPPNYGAVWRVPQMAGDSPIILRRTAELLNSGEEWRLWQLFNVKYQLRRDAWNDPGLEQIAVADGLHVYRVVFSLPRVWAVTNFHIADSEMAAMRSSLDANFHPGDRVVLEERPTLPVEPSPRRPDTEVLEYSPQYLKVRASATDNAMVVVADAFHPGWQTYLNGHPAKTYLANYGFRAVELPVGDHIVEMKFEPTSFRIGLVVTLLALLCAASAFLVRRSPGRAASS